MEKFYDSINTQHQPSWLVFSIIKELYTNDLETLKVSNNSKTSLADIRGFLIQDKFITNVIYPDVLDISPSQYKLLESLKLQIKEIPQHEYESYVLFVSYLKYILVENVKDLIIDFINFDGISDFIITLELLQKHRLTHPILKEMFADIIYASDKSNFPSDLYPLIQKVFVSSKRNKLVHMTKKLKDYEDLIENSPMLDLPQDEMMLKILNATAKINVMIPSILDMKELSFNIVSSSQKINKGVKEALKIQLVPVILQLPRLMCNSYLNLLFKIREYTGSKITTQNKNFCLFVDNQRKVPQGVDLEWFEAIRSKRTLNFDEESD